MLDSVLVRRKKIIIKDILKESRELINGLKFPIFWRTMLFFSAKELISFLAISLLFSTILFPHSSSYKLISMGVFIFVLSYFVWWVYISAMVLGIRQSIGLPLKENLVSHFRKTKSQNFYLFLIVVMIFCLFKCCHHFIPTGVLGMLFKIALYVVTLYCLLPIFLFTLPLIITRKSTLPFALKSGFEIMGIYWFEVFVCFSIMLIILGISALPFGLGLIWTIPMSFAMAGILFRNIYGLKRNFKPTKFLLLEQFVPPSDQKLAEIQLPHDFSLPNTG